MKMVGHYGVGLKMQPLGAGELQLRGGPFVSYAEDPLRPELDPRERSEMLIELQYRQSVIGPLQVEYLGAASPAFDPLERHRLRQDVRFAVPVGGAGYLRLGARHLWQDVSVPRPLAESMQLYFGVGFRR
jgi:hypothetical protein